MSGFIEKNIVIVHNNDEESEFIKEVLVRNLIAERNIKIFSSVGLALSLFMLMEKDVYMCDILICQVGMEREIGPKIVEYLSSNDLEDNMKILFLGSGDPAALKNAASECGADDYLTYPYSSPGLMNIVGQWL